MGTVTDFEKDGSNKGLFVSGTGDFFIGKEDGDFIRFNASAGTIAISSSDLQVQVGDLNLTASDIDMTTNQFELDANNGDLQISSGETSMSLGEGKIILSGSTVPIIKVDGGEISASNFFVSSVGEVTASAGSIGGFIIDDHSLTTDGVEINKTGQALFISSSNFKVALLQASLKHCLEANSNAKTLESTSW